jgi:TonB family protein
MTDAQRVHISATSSATHSGHGTVISGTLVWRCSADDGREVFLLLGTYFGGNSDDQVLVEYRFDSKPASEGVWWNQSTSNRGAFMPSEDVPSFTEHVKRSNRLIIRVTDPLDSETVTYTFSLQGFTAAYRRIEATCPVPQQQLDSEDSSRTRVEGGIGTGIVPSSDEVFLESVVEERPEVLSGPQLQYPDLLRQAGIQGRVIVQAIIDTSGRAEPASVKVIQSPNPGFDQPAKTYVLQALFRPARLHGRAVRVLVNLPIDFKISGRR